MFSVSENPFFFFFSKYVHAKYKNETTRCFIFIILNNNS